MGSAGRLYTTSGPPVSMHGTYLLLLQCPTTRDHLQIGRLGCYRIAAGSYLYVGSAHGSGGLTARLARHQQRQKQRPHWHIDYLRAVTNLWGIWSVATPQRLEQVWGEALLSNPTLQQPIPGFGASDSPLPTHLWYHPSFPAIELLSDLLIRPLLHQQKEGIPMHLQMIYYHPPLY